MKSYETLKEKFQKITNMGYIKSTRQGYTGSGKTFEDLLEKKEDHIDLPDYNEIEIKTKLEYSKSYTTLFNATPKGNHNYEIKWLVQNYGYKDTSMTTTKVLQNSVYVNQLNCIGNRYLFGLEIDRKQQKVFLKVLDRNYNLIEKNSYWSFSALEERLYRKLKYLALVKVKKKTIKNEVYYNYYQMNLYKLKDFQTFLSLLEDGTIRITFHIGTNKSGPKKGEIHDRGTSFEIKEEDISKLYVKIE